MSAPSAAPRVTVAIPAYNSAGTLRRAVLSATGQSLAAIEILIADDGSTDGTGAVAAALAEQDRRIRVISIQPNGGKPAAMNRMAAEAQGHWFAVLDADDAYHERRLDTLLAAAERQGCDLAADNIVYVDAGADAVIRTAFNRASPDRAIGLDAFWAHSDPHAGFDFGILKPIIRRDFLRRHALTYFNTSLSEDFYYLMNFFLAGGAGVLVGEPLYYWTMPFGPLSRAWTETGNGAWRYDYRQALAANDHYLDLARRRGDGATAARLQGRSRQYRTMMHYLDAQRAAAGRDWGGCLSAIAGHPSTYPLLVRRVAGRLGRRFRRPAAPGLALPHPSLRA